MRHTSFLQFHILLGIVILLCGGCYQKSSQDDSNLKVKDTTLKSTSEAPESQKNISSLSTADWLEWLPLNHSGYTRSKDVTTDFGDLPRVQVTYTSDSDPESFFVLDVLDGKGPLVVAVRGMINAKLAKKYEETLLDGYVKVYQNYGVTAFERHTPADGKTFLEYAIDDRFYFNYKGENINPDLLWEFFQVLDPKQLAS